MGRSVQLIDAAADTSPVPGQSAAHRQQGAPPCWTPCAMRCTMCGSNVGEGLPNWSASDRSLVSMCQRQAPCQGAVHRGQLLVDLQVVLCRSRRSPGDLQRHQELVGRRQRGLARSHPGTGIATEHGRPTWRCDELPGQRLQIVRPDVEEVCGATSGGDTFCGLKPPSPTLPPSGSSRGSCRRHRRQLASPTESTRIADLLESSAGSRDEDVLRVSDLASAAVVAHGVAVTREFLPPVTRSMRMSNSDIAPPSVAAARSAQAAVVPRGHSQHRDPDAVNPICRGAWASEAAPQRP